MSNPDNDRAIGRLEAEIEALKEKVEELKRMARESDAWRVEHDRDAIAAEFTDERKLTLIQAEDQGVKSPKVWKDRFEVLQKAFIALAAGVAAVASIYTMIKQTAASQSMDPKQIAAVVVEIQKAQKSVEHPPGLPAPKKQEGDATDAHDHKP